MAKKEHVLKIAALIRARIKRRPTADELDMAAVVALEELHAIATEAIESWELMKLPSHPHTAVPFMQHERAMTALGVLINGGSTGAEKYLAYRLHDSVYLNAYLRALEEQDDGRDT